MKGKNKRQSKYNCVISSPIGKLGIAVINNKVAKISLLSPRVPLISPKSIAENRIINGLKGYFRNPKLRFDLFTHIQGTPLQKKIWRALKNIPQNKVVTYGELAKKIKTSPRVIGNACRLNPLPIIIPCHRVVSATGLGGYCGKSSKNIKIKKWLIEHENKNSII